jgi:hypothetical protein
VSSSFTLCFSSVLSSPSTVSVGQRATPAVPKEIAGAECAIVIVRYVELNGLILDGS